jgi:hypothetical protein
MARTPRLSLAGLRQSQGLVDGVDAIVSVLRERHPGNPNLAAASTLFTSFERDLSTAILNAPGDPDQPEPVAAATRPEILAAEG